MIKKIAKRSLAFIGCHQRARMVVLDILVLATLVLGVLWIRNPEGHFKPVFSILGVLAAIISALPKAIEFLAHDSNASDSEADADASESRGRTIVAKYDVFSVIMIRTATQC